MHSLRIASLLFLILFLVSCGSGDGAGSGQNAPPADPKAPTLGAISDIFVDQGGPALSFNLSATDPNMSQLTFSMDGSVGGAYNVESAGATLSSDGAFYWDYNGNGIVAADYVVEFTVTNAEGYSDSQNVTITLGDGSPIVATIPDQTATLGSTTPVSFSVSASDPNGLSLTYAVDASYGAGTDPSVVAAFNASTQQFSWDISAQLQGVYSVKFVVTNSNGKSSEVIAKITIQDANAQQFANGESKYNGHCRSCHGPEGRLGSQTPIQCIDSLTYYGKVNGGSMSGYASSFSTQDKADVLYYLNNVDPSRC